MEQELPTLPELLGSPQVFNGSRSLVLCVVFCRLLLVLLSLFIVLSVFLRLTASDYPFGIFKLFLSNNIKRWWTYISISLLFYSDCSTSAFLTTCKTPQYLDLDFIHSFTSHASAKR